MMVLREQRNRCRQSAPRMMRWLGRDRTSSRRSGRRSFCAAHSTSVLFFSAGSSSSLWRTRTERSSHVDQLERSFENRFMLLDTIHGVIARRVLLNFRIDPEVMSKALPPPFRPKLYRGRAIGGVCMIRFEELRPRFAPAWMGMASERPPVVERRFLEARARGESLRALTGRRF